MFAVVFVFWVCLLVFAMLSELFSIFQVNILLPKKVQVKVMKNLGFGGHHGNVPGQIFSVIQNQALIYLNEERPIK